MSHSLSARLAFLSVVVAAVAILSVSAAAAADKPLPVPPAGQEFLLSSTFPKYVTADFEFRDPSGKQWPVFAWGKPLDGGKFVYDPKQPQAAFGIRCDKFPQSQGDQSRRIVGELIKPDGGAVITFSVLKVGPVQSVSATTKDARGRAKTTTREVVEAEAELTIDERKIPIRAELSYQYPHGIDKSLYLTARFTVPGAALGLKAAGSTGPIEVRASVSAYSAADVAAAGAKKKK